MTMTIAVVVSLMVGAAFGYILCAVLTADKEKIDENQST